MLNLHLGYVTLLPMEFQPPNCPPQLDLQGRVASRWALPQISSFYMTCYCLNYNLMLVWVCKLIILLQINRGLLIETINVQLN